MDVLPLRISDGTRDRVDALLPWVSANADAGAMRNHVTRSDVARLALERGLRVLEQESRSQRDAEREAAVDAAIEADVARVAKLTR